MRKKAMLILILSIFLFSTFNLMVKSSQEEAPLIPIPKGFIPKNLLVVINPQGSPFSGRVE